ncbi:TetR/AcrR family transcriptional regulator C-terminal domain-containing protein [Thalassospira sp.]|uniref:TetR/AcrR family transcriptional regulator C-terminal domain-containing protein n=1 Tax=Thalassospira sp. TaxID=1912094 RepID=UPI002733292D|nr:TetR/AcrR family transcriptional regulator C-terminal domain-containing protein [Thalassospira sp.]MDP2697542.1 TetR/AcrR family transcriptional regulator C-terminal domain-containing protein [Thalassospira sp.]
MTETSETPDTEEKHPSRGAARKRAMMDCAWDILMESGFSGVTLNEVISRSGGSRTTLYEAFGGKDGLIAAVLAERCHEFSVELLIALETDLPPRDALTDFAIKLARKILSEDAIRITQILLSEGHHFPGITDTFLSSGPDCTTSRLASYLERQAKTGAIMIDDPTHAAEILVSMVQGQWLHRMLKKPPSPPVSDAEIAKRATRAVDIFLGGVARNS